jgi:uncharacterized protein YndB with AHSA1/START domain
MLGNAVWNRSLIANQRWNNTLCYTDSSYTLSMNKKITFQISIPASLSAVWQAWTTEAGAKTFLAPECKIDLCPGGAYEMYFDLDAAPGSKGGEGMILLAVQPEQMLSFTWNAPPNLPEVRGEMTHVALYFESDTPEITLVSLTHDGWGEGGQWDQAFDYFTRAWGEIVLPRLKYRFEKGPIQWENPPALGKREQ